MLLDMAACLRNLILLELFGCFFKLNLDLEQDVGYYFSIRLTVGKQSIKPKKANFKGIVSTNTWPRILLENLEKSD